ncbi:MULTISPECIES: 2-C-methyl-D-erythritol 2,4-cyclodiphosphate synthase [unclassified Lentimicrobium]|uniref:2-C-methyl-D-erythritol 2,4-cyclodiphosphate synthase n=1 Tax=unclassified Lentimicrobium TaxID=2677434 RepID=UPI001557DC8A|nr:MULTISPECIES: 2-C-methyl-D-erythritol 2,4-cyclodiphosphate synthase [unclassified Lentimicrobium]NPD46390.1 2-C-methyl-D-erythritol 2,4-cyclodiphosphate synthase [Lentimicrobium sp. S6]NPD83576.1 2-C-methyl-D-erythritol 2,4-cyclodiphosphate synthase [Lentimicrobium sp. L6]
MRIGTGFDVHQLSEGYKLILGGIEIPHNKGCVGHSDADVLIHAICDALLGALALGDIGQHFPDTSEEFKGIDSRILLKKVNELVRKQGYEISNIDSTLALQKPKVKPYIPQMRAELAKVLGIEINQVSVKATTTEKLGFEGREEGVSAQAVCILFKK